MTHPADATLDRLLRHMAWANQAVFAALGKLTAAQMLLHEPGSDVSVAAIAHHLVDAQRWYLWRLQRYDLQDFEQPTSPTEFAEMAELLTVADAGLRAEAAKPEGPTEFERAGKLIVRARSTIIAQAIHHCTEHRAQLADTLAAHEIKLIDLDELDLWAYGIAEGLGA